ncbi:1-deoxy-D-xylulose-5-phosphate reductoisomerase [Catenibacillus scindens]|uniref:1-deoxy-D-xylulose 5-phosphate reductoisomerase n=1 Tax=Catenibacillus scindens TaxID=673271 RepID=A0A7W8H8J0_9FIRM|nr:1-deoxy-D-xylulose-5-phosphate reductoisomerase [Catenibacillus scindens]MBB5263135.1 1-deoxy-D-xylulose-5-phosphate reductoisomerase [Catenibacillus scindens]
MKYISILGSTGSIGTQTLDIVEHNRDLCVRALAAGRNVTLLEKQIRQFHPVIAAVWDEKDAADLRNRVADLSVKIVSGMSGLIDVVTEEKTQTVVTAIVGMIGIRPTIEAIKAGKNIALANKETLVTAGHLIMPMAKAMNVKILPVDSEHSAIFQSLQGFAPSQVKRILLTASGGPFRGWTKDELKNIRVEDALKHPNWVMGRKITIDSATMVNKGLEVMEACWLFDVSLDQIQVVVHPQSIIHSAVEYVDGGVIAQLGTPDMRLPIQYALFYPDRRDLGSKPLDLFEVGTMTFERPRPDVFEGLDLAYKAAMAGGSVPTVFNAANERAVAKFLDKKIGFLEIPEIIRKAMEAHTKIDDPDLDQILMTEQQTYDFIESRW